MNLHFPSIAFTILALIATSLFPVQGHYPVVPSAVPVRVVVDNIPRPQDYMIVDEGVPFLVPTGKVFVLTALGHKASTMGSGLVSILVDGAVAAADDNKSFREFPLGVRATAGSVVEVSGSNAPRAWGYLVTL